MNSVPTASRPKSLPESAPDTAAAAASLEHATPARDGSIGGFPDEHGFAAMRMAYHAVHGIADGDRLAGWLDERQRGGFERLARLIVAGEVLSFEWHDTVWVPMFQFDPRDLTVKQASRQVLAELATELDGWRLAAWFVEPNCRLNDHRPIDLLDSNLPAVLEAARAERCLLTTGRTGRSACG